MMSDEHIVNNVYQYNHHRGSLRLPVQGFALKGETAFPAV